MKPRHCFCSEDNLEPGGYNGSLYMSAAGHVLSFHEGSQTLCHSALHSDESIIGYTQTSLMTVTANLKLEDQFRLYSLDMDGNPVVFEFKSVELEDTLDSFEELNPENLVRPELRERIKLACMRANASSHILATQSGDRQRKDRCL